MFCNQECKLRYGEANATSKYRTTKVGGKTVYTHRIVAEKATGRKISKKENVHHKDEDKRNNDPTNLEILSTRDHALAHQQIKWDIDQAKQLAASGATIPQIADALGVRYEAVRSAFSIRGIKTVRGQRRTVVDTERAKELLQNGKSHRQIASIMGFSHVTISKVLKATY
jgi:DNA-binding CsgD family transcriptional regulator